MESNSERSLRCLKSIQSTRDTKAKVVFLVGRLGAGKSSLTEIIARVEGLSSSGIHSATDECQIFDADIDGEEYFVVDTPGFEPNNKGEIFRQITEMLQQLTQNSIFGMWYLINNLNRQDGFDQEMIAWLTALCGDSFCPNVTIVTTFWTGEGGMLRNQNQNLQQRLDEEWAELQAFGARHHAFGKHYFNGIPQDSTISLFDLARREGLEQQVANMVTSSFRSESTSQPKILRELGEPRALHMTSAGRIFLPQNQQVPPMSASPEDQGAPKEASGTEENEPRHENKRSARSLFGEAIVDIISYAVRGLVDVAVAEATGGAIRMPSARAPRQRQDFQQPAFGGESNRSTNLNRDPLSSQDTAALYNHPGDYESRQAYYNSWGLNALHGEFKGTANQGDALRAEMHKRWGG